ncbi:MAG: DUF3786 domain-containing protein [Desulfobacterales bacterium]
MPVDSDSYRPDGSHLDVDAVYWERLDQRDLRDICGITLFEPAGEGLLEFPFLDQSIRIDIPRRRLHRRAKGRWVAAKDPLLTLATVLYLVGVDAVHPIGRDIVGVRDLKEGHFFRGPHELRLQGLLDRYGSDPVGFRRAAEALGGTPVDMADAAYRLMPFPRVPIYYLFWVGDDEFAPEIRILFDRSIEASLQADAIWALANRVSRSLEEAG